MADNPIPAPRDDDDEDIHWALSTSLTLWSRGERAEALKWLKRAAEQASDADKDIRSLELFKAAAELQPLAAANPVVAPAPSAPVPTPKAPAPQPAPPPAAAVSSRLPPPPLPTNRPPPPARAPQPSLPPATQASPSLPPSPMPLRSAPPPAPRASARPPAPGPGQTPAPTSVAPPPRAPSMPSAPPPAAHRVAPPPATPTPPPVAMPTRKRLPSRTGARKSVVAGDPLARTGKQPVAPAGAPQGGAGKPAGASGKRAAPKTTIIDQAWGDFVPSSPPVAPPPPPEEEVTAERNRAALLDMPIDDLDGVTNIFSGRDVAKQVAAARAGAPGSQRFVPQSPVTITGLPAPVMHAPATTPAPAPAAHTPAPATATHTPAPAAHTPAPTSVQAHSVSSVRSNKGAPASVRPAFLPSAIGLNASPAIQPAQAYPPQPTPSQPSATPAAASQPAQAPAAAPASAPRVATVAAVKVAVFGREGDIRLLALAPQSAAPPGTITALLVPTSDADAAALAKLFGL